MSKITISIADDHNVVREGLARILDQMEEFEVRIMATNGQELLDKLNELTVTDIVLLDIDMPVMDGIETLHSLRAKYGDTIRILGLSVHEEIFIVQNMMEEGANGFISKKASSEDLRHAILSVMKHDFYLNPTFSRELLGKRYSIPESMKLTKTEEEIILLICQEMNNKEIAEHLKLSPNTVNAYRTKILEKTGTTNTAGLVVYAIKSGLYRV